jgi:hypothetical protein
MRCHRAPSNAHSRPFRAVITGHRIDAAQPISFDLVAREPQLLGFVESLNQPSERCCLNKQAEHDNQVSYADQHLAAVEVW